MDQQLGKRRIRWSLSKDKNELIVRIDIGSFMGLALSLTPREKEILPLLLQGAGHKEIASLLNISERTSKYHASAVYSKVHVSGKQQMVSLLMHSLSGPEVAAEGS